MIFLLVYAFFFIKNFRNLVGELLLNRENQFRTPPSFKLNAVVAAAFAAASVASDRATF